MSAAAIVDGDATEIPEYLTAELDSCRRLVAAARKNPSPALQRGAACVFRTVTKDTPDLFRAAVDEIYSIANAAGMMDDDTTQKIINDAIAEARMQSEASAQSYETDPIIQAWERNDPRNKGRTNGHDAAAPIPSQDDYGTSAVQLPATINDTSAIVPATFITPASWPREAPPSVEWLAASRIPRGDVTTLSGDGGAGKSDSAIQLGEAVARDAQVWFGHEIATGPVLFISAEEPERELRRRIWLHSQRDRYDPNTLASLHLWFPDKKSGDAIMAVADRYTGIMRPTRIMQEIAAAIRDLAPVLVIVDNVAATFAGNQNDRVMVRSYVNLWRQIAHGPSRPAVLLLDHPSLSGLTNNTGRGGNMDWRNAVRSALWLHPPAEAIEADRGIRILETAKSNYGPPGNPLRLVWADGGLQLEHAPSSHHRAAKEQQCDETFMRLLDERAAQGSHVGRKTSAMYAPKVFADAPDNGGFTKHAFAAAMERLFKAGTIREAYDSKRRHDYIDRASAAA
jgi:RecA-family ATPase